jgi:hypothetical protein
MDFRPDGDLDIDAGVQGVQVLEVLFTAVHGRAMTPDIETLRWLASQIRRDVLAGRRPLLNIAW